MKLDEAQEKINKEFFKIIMMEYKDLRLRICNVDEPKINDEYKILRGSEMYIENNKELISKFERFITAFNKLSKLQRNILYFSYLDENHNDTGFIANSLGYSKGYFHELKRETIKDFLTAYGLITIR